VSLKENIDMVKEELNQEEKLFESAVKTERFVKKYKMPLISVLVAVVVVLIGNSLYQAKLSSEIALSNEAYLELMKDPKNTEAASTLKDNNSELYDGWKLQIALKEQDKTALESLKSSSTNIVADIVADIAAYELAAINRDKSALNDYALNQDAVLKDLAILNEAVLLMQEGKTDEAQARLKMISEQSSLQKVVSLLQHYGVK